MILGFEEYTHELDYQEKAIAKFIKDVGLGRHPDFPYLTPERPLGTNEFCKQLTKRFGIKVGEERLRKIIGYLRIGHYPVLYQAKSKKDNRLGGYFISWEREKIEQNVKSLTQRGAGVLAAANGLDVLLAKIDSGELQDLPKSRIDDLRNYLDL